MISIVRVPSLPLVLTKADHHFRAHDARRVKTSMTFKLHASAVQAV
jgi:hypothetical protein